MHIVLRAGRPAVRGMLMLLLMTFGISGYVDPGYFNVGDVLGMLVFIGAFPMRSVFCRHVWWGLSSESLIPAFADCGGFCCYARCYPPLLWFAECRSAYFWYDRGFAGTIAGFYGGAGGCAMSPMMMLCTVPHHHKQMKSRRGRG